MTSRGKLILKLAEETYSRDDQRATRTTDADIEYCATESIGLQMKEPIVSNNYSYTCLSNVTLNTVSENVKVLPSTSSTGLIFESNQGNGNYSDAGINIVKEFSDKMDYCDNTSDENVSCSDFNDDDDDDPDFIPNSEEELNDNSLVREIRKKHSSVKDIVHHTSEDKEAEPMGNMAVDNDNQIKKSRKRLRAMNTWRRNEIKSKRNKGEEYMNWKGNHVKQRSLKEVCNNCRFKCSLKFSEDQRKAVFSEFWNLGDIDRQRDFIINNIKQKPKRRERMRNEDDNTDSRRKMSYFYFLKCCEKEERVCQHFFLNTLSISQQMVKTAFSKKQPHSNTVSKDRRGKAQCNSKLPDTVKISVKNHIESFPTVESHYCRKDSKREYLDKKLNLAKMYELYISYCKEKNITSFAKQSMYRYIFNTEYNLGFFQPKKDLCDLCEKIKNMNEEEKLSIEKEMNSHLRNKVAAREAKERAKERCKIDKTYFAAVYDMQQVLQTPQLEVSQLYYRRKLSSYNLSIYDLYEKKGFCYMWDETKGRRGSNEISTCVKNIIDLKVMEGKKEMCFFSDNCGGQNLNRNVVVMYLYLAINNNIKITHCFLEKGHTQNEGDSVHSSIERASKNITIYAPDQWYLLARTACKKSPYEVFEMESFYDFLVLRNETCNRMDKDENGEKVRWQKVRVIMVDPEEVNSVFIKYDYDENFIRINIETRTRKKLSPLLNKKLQKAYKSDLPISSKKFHDLEYLCTNRVIPAAYHSFYKNLKHSNKIQDFEDAE